MALATPQATISIVKELGGIQAEDDYLLWRFSSPDELDALLTRCLQRAASRIYRRAPTFYTETDENVLSDLAVGEGWLTLHLAIVALKSRKVFGTHWALDQEDSSRFQELIDNEYLTLAEEALGVDLTTSTGTSAFARPVLLVGPVIDPLTDLTLESEDVQLEEIADTARAWPTIPIVTRR